MVDSTYFVVPTPYTYLSTLTFYSLPYILLVYHTYSLCTAKAHVLTHHVAVISHKYHLAFG